MPLAAAGSVDGTGASHHIPSKIGELALLPGICGVFEIRVDGNVVWFRADMGRFPEMKELKQLVRDRIAPGRDLGHSDR